MDLLTKSSSAVGLQTPLQIRHRSGQNSVVRWPTNIQHQRFHRRRTSTTRLLLLGQALVRKGIHDLVARTSIPPVARRCWALTVPFRIPSRNDHLPRIGRRSEVANWYSKADVFVLPTHSDGFAVLNSRPWPVASLSLPPLAAGKWLRMAAAGSFQLEIPALVEASTRSPKILNL